MRVAVDRYDDPPPQSHTVVQIDTTGHALSDAQVGAAVDRLLGKSIARKPLPDAFQVTLGDARDALEDELRRRLRQPSANWNLSTGKPRHGDYGTVVRYELAAVIAASPIAAAFRHHGYTLQLDGIARLTMGDTAETRHLPGHIDEMPLTAHRKAH
ncbi:hypothetical protein [Polymorphobacter megasporae]|uniref:hypothetical protein n=1 Tax=Glacieibacterium megasporae TaxID=2835787 RepID=UPI001C1E3C84|nr:hypothetical protein [Polymorphobacter megasporae]UAJ10663.1 hypothetical protein KTC28_02605 [Polymorphobacter megasporae]